MSRLKLIAICALLTACAGVTTPLARNAAIKKDKAYVYGVYYMQSAFNRPDQDDQDPESMNFESGTNFNNGDKLNTLVRKLSKTDNSGARYFPFTASYFPFVVEVSPGTYSLPTIGYFWHGTFKLKEKKDIFKNSVKSIKLEAGKIYYLGNFTGTPSDEISYGPKIHIYGWQLTGYEDNFEETKSKVMQLYPGTQSLEYVNLTKQFTLMSTRGDRNHDVSLPGAG